MLPAMVPLMRVFSGKEKKCVLMTFIKKVKAQEGRNHDEHQKFNLWP